jgi:hypothetical protein
VVLWCGLGKSARLARVRGSPVRYVNNKIIIYFSPIELLRRAIVRISRLPRPYSSKKPYKERL